MLVEEGRLNHKLSELDKLERSAMNNPNPAWSVKSCITFYKQFSNSVKCNLWIVFDNA